LEKKAAWGILLTLILFPTSILIGLFPIFQSVGTPEQTTFRVCPATLTVGAGETFSVNITLENIPANPGAAGFEFILNWNASILKGISMEEVVIHSVTPPEEWWNIWAVYHDVWNDSVHYGYTWYNITRALEEGYAPISGDVTVATVTLKAIAQGETIIHFQTAIIGDPEGNPIPNTPVDGSVTALPRFYVNPPSITVKVCTTFVIDVKVDYVAYCLGAETELRYNNSMLHCLGISGAHLYFPIDETEPLGYIYFYNIFWDGPISGNFTLASIEFKCIGPGECVLHLHDTVLADPNGNPISHITADGYSINIAEISHDIAITDITILNTIVEQGFSMPINVAVANQGGFTETFNVTVYANTTSIALQYLTLTCGSSTTLTFTWNTTDVALGYYTIWAHASIVPGENDTVDNTLIDGTIQIRPGFHDVAITNVRTHQNFVYAGENVSIYVDVWNRGSFLETFNVTTYADENSTIIGDEITIGNQSLSLPSKGFTTLTFFWNTTGVSPGNYTISAVASTVPEEADPTDNLYINGKIGIFVPIPCYDINIISPIYIKLNPSIFQFDWNVGALKVSLGDMTIESAGYEGLLRVLGSTNGNLHLRIDQPNLEYATYYLPQSGSIQVPLWLLFDPGTYSGTYELQLTICGVHKLKITIDVIDFWVCSNGAYSRPGATVTFSYTLEGGSWVYLEAQPELPSGWSFTVDPPIGTLFETPHQILVNITAAPDAEEGDIGSVTLRAYKNGTNILIWQYTFFASVDSKPPTIETIQPPISTFNGQLLFNATVKDVSGIESVQLYYSVDNGPWNNQSMQWNSGDTFNSTSYTLIIPHVPDNSSINYYIVATDWLRNQTQSDIQTLTVKYDLAITEVKTGKTVLGQGFLTQINVRIANQGTIPNTSLKIAVYANTTLIHTQTIPFLTNGVETTISFYWNTTNLPKGNYKITAFAIPILGETDATDNMLSDGWVFNTFPGDVNADQKVNILDCIILANHFGHVNGNGHTPGTKEWQNCLNSDINSDNRVNILDCIILAGNFGKKWP